MIKHFLSLALLLQAAIVHGQTMPASGSAYTPSISFEKCLSLKQSGTAVLSPNGDNLAYTVTTTDWKENTYHVESGVDYLNKKGIIDTTRMGCMGWSQGGYISAFLTTHTPIFKAISVGAGISDWATYYVATDITPFTREYLKATAGCRITKSPPA